MGNYRFRLSTMIPNAWFYKLKDMSRASRSHRIQNSQKRRHPQRSTSSTTTTEQFYLPKRTSYYFPSRERAEQPPNSPINTKTSHTHFPNDPLKKSKHNNPKVDFNGVELGLPPILTKPTKNSAKRSQLYGDPNENWKRISCKDGNFIEKSPARIAHRVKIRAISPVIAGKKRSIAAAKQRNGLKESFAIVKMSSDPKRDFRESMIEMIVENDTRGSKGLEELLACYLALNSNEYHEVIVDVFKEIWFDLTRI